MAVRSLFSSALTIPPAAAINAAAGARPLAAAGARSLIPVVYGIDRVPALILNVLPKAGDATRILVQCLWVHQCHSVDELRLNDQALPGTATVTSYTGSQSTADATLVAAFAAQSITYTDTLAGYAYSVIDMLTRDFDGQLNFSARIYGRKVYDVRLDSTAGGSGSHRLADATTWAWSDNPALALADWSASTVYGAGRAVLWSSVHAAANAADAMIGSPAEKRRIIGVTIGNDGVTVKAISEALRAYAGCWLIPTGGGLKLLADADAAAVASYDHASGQIAALEPLALRDLGGVPTVVEVIYTDTTNIPWREASAFAQVAGAGTTKPWRLNSVRLPGIQRYSQALREATERLNKLNLGDLSTVLEAFDIGIRHEPGDIVTLTHPVGLAAKPMRVTGVEMPLQGRWRLALVEHDPAAYSDTVTTAPSIADTSRVAPAGPPSNVGSFAGTVSKGRISWTWAPCPDTIYGATELRTGDGSWSLNIPAPTFRALATGYQQIVTSIGSYTLYARHLSQDGTPSSASVSATVSVSAGDLVQDGAAGAPGANGANGLNNATITIYKRSASAPALPTTTGTYTFATGLISGLDNGWTQSVPAGSNPLYVATATASSSSSTDTVAPGEWATPVILAQDGAQGSAGVNSATVFLFQRTASSSAPALPSDSVTYTFATGAASGVNNGWTQSMPAGGGSYRWQTTATALGTGATDSIAAGEWSAAALMAQDGATGATGATGASGADGISSTLSLNAWVLPADSLGVVSSFSGAVSTMKVLKGTADDSSNWTFSRTDGSGVTSSLAGQTVTVTACANDTGYVDITATRSGYPTQTLRFALSKAKSATPASGPVSFSVTESRTEVNTGVEANSYVRFNTDGTLSKRSGNSGGWTAAGNWYAPTTTNIGSSYQLMTLLAGDALAAGTVGTFEALSTERICRLEQPVVVGEASKVCTLTHLIAPNSSTVPAATGYTRLTSIYTDAS